MPAVNRSVFSVHSLHQRTYWALSVKLKVHLAAMGAYCVDISREVCACAASVCASRAFGSDTEPVIRPARNITTLPHLSFHHHHRQHHLGVGVVLVHVQQQQQA